MTNIYRKILYLLSIIVLTPYALTVLYLWVNPPSTLMLARWITWQPVAQEWVALGNISQPYQMAVLLSEDSAFCEHHGMDFRQLDRSLKRAWKYDTSIRGTSTITQQVAKNLFLWNGRSWLRKILEAPLALWIDLIWPKSRILEVYFNIAEWGDGVYGAEAAARTHFKRPARQIGYVQASLLATALPNPLARNAAHPSTNHRLLAGKLLSRLQRSRPDTSCL